MNTEHIEKIILGHFLGDLTDFEEKELYHWLQAVKRTGGFFRKCQNWWPFLMYPISLPGLRLTFQKRFGELM